MSTAIEKYRNIMRRYYDGEFGNKSLQLYEILKLTDALNIFDEMTSDELSELILETTSVPFKTALSQIRDKKLSRISTMKIKSLIPIEKRHYHICYFCKAVQSVKYIVMIDDPEHPGQEKEVSCCNRCTLFYKDALTN